MKVADKTVLRFRQKQKMLKRGKAGLYCINLFQFHGTSVERRKERWAEIKDKENEIEKSKKENLRRKMSSFWVTMYKQIGDLLITSRFINC